MSKRGEAARNLIRAGDQNRKLLQTGKQTESDRREHQQAIKEYDKQSGKGGGKK